MQPITVQNAQLLGQTGVTSSRSANIRGALFDDFPLDCGVFTLLFEAPDVRRQAGVFFRVFVLKGLLVFGVPLLERLLCGTNVVFFFQLAGDSRLVDDGGPQAFTRHWAEVSLSAVAPRLFGNYWFCGVIVGAQ